MSNTVLFSLVAAVFIAFLIAGFQYLFKVKTKSKVNYFLFLLRFLSVLLLLVLLINPKIKKQIITTVKPSLVVLTDDSKSITKLKQANNVKRILLDIKNNKALTDKFKLDFYSFSDIVKQSDSLFFKANETNINKALVDVSKLYKGSIAPTILISDGNQTKGVNYTNFLSKHPIYPVVVGDTVTYQDIKITQLNVNKYAYLKHKFPIEAFILYEGNAKNVQAKFTITENNAVVYSKNIVLNSKNNSAQLSFHIPANSVGFHEYKAHVSYLKDEKNRINNTKDFSVEVINEKSKIALISSIIHPDIGMLKRSIESNKQRVLVVKKPTDIINFEDYQMLILYQPNLKFKTVFNTLKLNNKNFFIITGSKTNWNFLNNNQAYFSKKAIQKTEDYLSAFNDNFSTYLTKNLGFETFSPITDYFGDVSFTIPFETLLHQQIGSFITKQPLLATFEVNKLRGAVLFGEHSWRWRMSSFVEKKSFEPFDGFVNKLIQYLASNKRSSLLDAENKPYFYANENVNVKAHFYDANFEFNATANLWITVKNKNTNKIIKYPLALENNNYGVNITDLKAGNYSYKITDELQKNKVTGNFTILNYNIEEQFESANVKMLNQLAENSKGQLFSVNTINTLFKNLIDDDKYKAIQKTKEKVTPLIDWKWLLGIIAFLLSLEWFTRKFKGYV
ncbi:MAG: VWA domain-containing protein [Flavobacteriaceae bacterium]